MAKAQPEEIQLPWRPTVDGAVAEVGAIFRVELVGGDWRCSVKSGRCQTIIAKGLKSEAEGKRRAQAHAATMPEMREAKNEAAAAAKPRAKKPAAPRRSRKPREESREGRRAAAEPTEATSPPTAAAPSPAATAAPVITLQETEDGCLCGKTQGVCWVASDKEVALARPLPEAVKEQIAAAVAQHYAARRVASEPAVTTPSPVRAPAAVARAKKGAKAVPKKAAKKAAKKATKTRPAREERPAPEPAKKDGPTKGRKAGRGRGKKVARGKRAETKEEAPVNGKAKDNEGATPTPVTPPRRGKRAAEGVAAAPASEARRGTRATETATPTGPIAWSEVDGKPRGAAVHGTFLIEPEGQGFGLYFADASGQSRHIRSGSIPDLRRAAEELAARGEPAPLRDAPSREQDEALMRIFASGAVEGA